jgi:hypothetical protein
MPMPELHTMNARTEEPTPRPPSAGAWGRLRGVCLAAVLTATMAPALAQTTLTLYGGVRGGGDFIDDRSGETLTLDSGGAFSASIDWTLADGRQAQVFYSYQRSALPGSAFNNSGDVKVSVSVLHLGGRAFVDGSAASHGAYAVGGVGATFLSPGLDGLSSEIRPSINLGFGYQWALSRQVTLRTELRGYLTLINSNGGFFCSGGCVVAIRGDTLTQFEGLVGLSVGF